MARKIYCVETRKEYGSIKEAANELGVHASHIDMYLRGKTNTVKGYHLFVSRCVVRKVKCWKTGKVYDDVASAATEAGVSVRALQDCLYGITRSCGGSWWLFVETETDAELFGETRAEVWKKVEGLERYSVSTAGRLRNDETRKIVKGTEYEGYIRILINGKQRLIHRLVAQTFIPNTDNKPQVNHKNGIKHDNRVENLEWVTGEENLTHAVEILGVDARPRKYVCFDNGKVYHSKRELARDVGVDAKHINKGGNEWFVLKGLNYQEII